MPPRITAVAVAVALATATVAGWGVGPASAASVGGVRARQLTAVTMVSPSGAPTVRAWENFNGANSTSMAATTTDGGSAIWSVIPAAATWRISSNRVRSSTVASSLVIDGGTGPTSSVVTMARGGTTFDAGLSVASTASGTEHLSCRWTSAGSSSIQIWRHGPAPTLLGETTGLAPGGIASAPASLTLRCRLDGATVTASVNGLTVVTVTLSPSDAATFADGSHRWTGPYLASGSTTSFDNFHLDVS